MQHHAEKIPAALGGPLRHPSDWRSRPRPREKVQGGVSRARPGGTDKVAEEAPRGWRVRQEDLGKTEVGVGSAGKRGGRRKKSRGEQGATKEKEGLADGSGHLAKSAQERDLRVETVLSSCCLYKSVTILF